MVKVMAMSYIYMSCNTQFSYVSSVSVALDTIKKHKYRLLWKQCFPLLDDIE